jgi:hypothetical protein
MERDFSATAAAGVSLSLSFTETLCTLGLLQISDVSHSLKNITREFHGVDGKKIDSDINKVKDIMNQ